MTLNNSKIDTLMEIKINYESGADISYGAVSKNNIALLKRACRYYGSWEAAVNLAGINYDNIRKYKKWDKEKVTDKIREYYAKGENLSWRYVSLTLDPQLAAAALHGGRFSSWNEALASAKVPLEGVSRYQKWTTKRIQEELEKCLNEGIILERNSLAKSNPRLIAAIYRIGKGLVRERQILFERTGKKEENKYRIKNTVKTRKVLLENAKRPG